MRRARSAGRIAAPAAIAPATIAPVADASRGPLLWLAAANFVVGLGAFVVIGVLVPIADGLGVSHADAGLLMTIYAIAYAIASPLLVAATGAASRRKLLAAGLAIFAAGAGLAALAPSFALVLVARAVMAVGGGVVTPVAAAAGLALVEPARRGRALAIVFGGLTLAQALGVPAGAWLGYAFGWRAAFAVVALLSLAVAALLLLRLPRGLAAPVTRLADLARVLRAPALVAAVGFTAIFIGALYVLYTYLAPLLEALGLGRDGVSAMLLVYGLGAVAGNWLGGRLTDRIGPGPTLLALCAAQVAIMPLLTLGGFGMAAIGLLVLLWSTASWSFMVPQQVRLASLRPELAPVLFALNAAAIYLGASLGAGLGGAVLEAWGLAWLGPVAAVAIVLAAATLPLATRLLRSAPAS